MKSNSTVKKTLEIVQYILAIMFIVAGVYIGVVEEEFAKASWFSILGFGLYIVLVLNWLMEGDYK